MKVLIDDYNNKITINNIKVNDLSDITKNLDSDISIRSISGVSIMDYRFLNIENDIVRHIELDSFNLVNRCFFMNVNSIKIAIMTDTNFTILFSFPNLINLGFEEPNYTILLNDKFYSDISKTNIKKLYFNEKIVNNVVYKKIVEKFGNFVNNSFIRQ